MPPSDTKLCMDCRFWAWHDDWCRSHLEPRPPESTCDRWKKGKPRPTNDIAKRAAERSKFLDELNELLDGFTYGEDIEFSVGTPTLSKVRQIREAYRDLRDKFETAERGLKKSRLDHLGEAAKWGRTVFDIKERAEEAERENAELRELLNDD